MNLIIREWLNGALFPLDVALTIAIGIYLSQSYLEARASRVSFRTLSGVQTACGLWWVFLCESIRAGVVYMSLNAQNHVRVVPPDYQEVGNALLLVAAFTLVITTVRCIYLFTPRSWAGRFCCASILVTIAFLLITHYAY